MVKKDQYDPEVYKRLELVKKQFRNNAAEQKKQQAAERKQRVLSTLGENKGAIVRITAFTIMAMIVIAVVATRISEIFRQ
jgi:hypothetical protein